MYTFILNIYHFISKPDKLFSPTTVLKQQKGNCFDYSMLLCSLLIGAGYDAYCVCGYATKQITLLDQTRNICPLLRSKEEVYKYSRVIHVFCSPIGGTLGSRGTEI